MRKFSRCPRLLKFQLVTLLVMACLLFAVGTYSWLSNNREIAGKENQIITEDETETILGDYTVFVRSTQENKDGSIKTTYQVLNSLESITLSTYDSVFGRNNDTAVILRVPVIGTYVDGEHALNFTLSRANTEELSASCADEYGLLANTTNADLHIEKDKIINYLSNIAAFKFAIIPSLNDYKSTQANAQTIYEGAEAFFHDASNSVEQHSFATQTKTGKIYNVTKTTNEITWNLDANYGAENLTDDDILYLYVEVDYEKYLTAAYLQNHEGNFAVGKLGETQLLTFVGDLSMLEVNSISTQ